MKIYRILLTFMFVSGLAAGCAGAAGAGTATPGAPTTLTVLAAASLLDSFQELGRQFEAAHPGVKVAFNFAGSQQLVQQLDGGAAADVFASAAQKQMDQAISAGRVKAGASREFGRNQLVTIFSKTSPAHPATLQDLARPGLKLVLAAKEVPVGQYALDFLAKASRDPGFGAAFQEQVLKNVVSYEENVKSVLTKVSLGEADAGIVYSTDVSGDAAHKVTEVEIPDALNSIASYPIAAIQDSPHADLAAAFVELVLSPAGQGVLSKYGFIPSSK